MYENISFYSGMRWNRIKGPLHYNESAQRSLCEWRYFDIRWYMLACVESRKLNGDQRFKIVSVRWRTFPDVGVR